jgi:hypothetical protein
MVTGAESIVGIATRYGLDGLGINPGGGKIFCTHPDQPQVPPSLLYIAYLVIPWGKLAEAHPI